MDLQVSPYADGIERFINQCNGIMTGEYHKLPIVQQRALYEALAAHFNGPVPDCVSVDETEYEADGVVRRFRIYRKEGGRSDAMVFYIRGGGFVLGSLETHHVLMADICAATGLDVVAPDFRLAPEAPFPAAIDDCQDVLRHVIANASALGLTLGKVLVCGDSSGGNMAVALCMRMRDAGEATIDAQLLFNPVLDFSRWRNGGGDAPLLTAGEMEFYTACYAPGDTVLHPHVSPLLRGDFRGLPPAYVMAAELDSLQVDSLTYADKLREVEVACELMVEKGLVHGAMRARNMSAAARAAFERACSKLVQFADA
ncbi:alpha/beta hydrolase [Methylobacterium indicum]|uniref:Carboxylesterase n=1 Tax=Methylobacterium indicum TaxID=1775910 RepID=A0A8H8X050_9HYPH|nr:alpha/beta hydrolase [Methylobacterium indicum]BCM87683.1 carboxylesterase [Methylobacterium indicum]